MPITGGGGVNLSFTRYADTVLPASGSYTIAGNGIFSCAIETSSAGLPEYYSDAHTAWLVQATNLAYGASLISDTVNCRIRNNGALDKNLVIMKAGY